VALESWSWRLVDRAAGRVVLVAATRCRDGLGADWGSVVVAAAGPEGERLVGERTVDWVAADPGRLSVELGPGVLRAEGDRLMVELEPDLRIDATFAEPWRWPRRLGGLGLGHAVPGLTQYWHPHLLGARVAGTARLGSSGVVALDGAVAYGEKNWGRGGTPRAWWWGQAVLEDDVVLAFAGGVLDAGPLSASATALAVRAGDELAALAQPFALIDARVDPGHWRIDGASATGWRVRVRGAAATPPFDLPVPVAGTRRLEAHSHQHLDGALSLELRRGRRVVYRGETALAGLERGGRDLAEADVGRSALPSPPDAGRVRGGAGAEGGAPGGARGTS
jgi:hypothetical protein